MGRIILFHSNKHTIKPQLVVLKYNFSMRTLVFPFAWALISEIKPISTAITTDDKTLLSGSVTMNAWVPDQIQDLQPNNVSNGAVHILDLQFSTENPEFGTKLVSCSTLVSGRISVTVEYGFLGVFARKKIKTLILTPLERSPVQFPTLDELVRKYPDPCLFDGKHRTDIPVSLRLEENNYVFHSFAEPRSSDTSLRQLFLLGAIMAIGICSLICGLVFVVQGIFVLCKTDDKVEVGLQPLRRWGEALPDQTASYE